MAHEIATNPDLKIHLETFSMLVGTQKGDNKGKDLIFMDRAFITREMKVHNPFYKEALQSLSMFRRKKGIADPKEWDRENIFYNPLILTKTGKTLKESEHFCSNKIFKLGQLLEEKSKEARNIPFDKNSVTLINNISLDIGTMDYGLIKDHTVFLGNTNIVKMSQISQKDLYEDAILYKSRDHSHQVKWSTKLNTVILWEEVWNTLHNFLLSNETRTAIWEQLHLNFYTQYSYNRWHKSSNLCPLCQKMPESIYHIILHCDFVNNVWAHLQPVLIQLNTRALDDAEKALGIVQIKSTPDIILRNWLGYKIREQILLFERCAYRKSKVPSLDIFKAKFNQMIATEVKHLMYRLKNEGKLDKFDEVLAFKGIICKKNGQGEYVLQRVFK